MAINQSQEQKDYLAQVIDESSASVRYLNPYYARWREEEYTLYHDMRGFQEAVNQGKRKKEHIRDFLLFAKVQSKHRKLRLLQNVVHFEGSPGQDTATVDLMNNILEYDYKRANKTIIDSLRNFSAIVYGVSDLLVHGIDKNGVVDMRVMHQPSFYFSPQAISGQGIEKKHQYKWAGYILRTTQNEIMSNKKYWDVDMTKVNLPTSPQWRILQTIQEEERQITRSGGKNDPVYLLSHYTYVGDKMMHFILADDTIVKTEELNFSHLPFITRQLYWIPNQRNTQSIPLQIADKQKIRQRLYNDSIKNELRSKSNIILFDKSKIIHPQILATNEEAAIPVNGDVGSAMTTMPRSTADNSTSYLITMMDDLSSEITGQTRQQQGIAPVNTGETATSTFTRQQQANENELAHVESFIEDDKALPRLIMENYITQTPFNFRKKILASSGLSKDEVVIIPASKLKTLSKDALGEVVVRNSLIEEQERTNRLPIVSSVIQYASLLIQRGADIDEAVRWAYETYGLSKDEIEAIIPPNRDIQQAEAEAIDIQRGITVRALITDNHRVHKIEHAKEDDSKAMQKHILEHSIFENILLANPQIAQLVQQQQVPLNDVGSLSPSGAEAPQTNNFRIGSDEGVALTQQQNAQQNI